MRMSSPEPERAVVCFRRQGPLGFRVSRCDVTGRPYVTQIREKSESYFHGVRLHDIIVGANGRYDVTVEELNYMLAACETLRLEIYRTAVEQQKLEKPVPKPRKRFKQKRADRIEDKSPASVEMSPGVERRIYGLPPMAPRNPTPSIKPTLHVYQNGAQHTSEKVSISSSTTSSSSYVEGTSMHTDTQGQPNDREKHKQQMMADSSKREMNNFQQHTNNGSNVLPSGKVVLNGELSEHAAISAIQQEEQLATSNANAKAGATSAIATCAVAFNRAEERLAAADFKLIVRHRLRSRHTLTTTTPLLEPEHRISNLHQSLAHYDDLNYHPYGPSSDLKDSASDFEEHEAAVHNQSKQYYSHSRREFSEELVKNHSSLKVEQHHHHQQLKEVQQLAEPVSIHDFKEPVQKHHVKEVFSEKFSHPESHSGPHFTKNKQEETTFYEPGEELKRHLYDRPTVDVCFDINLRRLPVNANIRGLRPVFSTLVANIDCSSSCSEALKPKIFVTQQVGVTARVTKPQRNCHQSVTGYMNEKPFASESSSISLTPFLIEADDNAESISKKMVASKISDEIRQAGKFVKQQKHVDETLQNRIQHLDECKAIATNPNNPATLLQKDRKAVSQCIVHELISAKQSKGSRMFLKKQLSQETDDSSSTAQPLSPGTGHSSTSFSGAANGNGGGNNGVAPPPAPKLKFENKEHLYSQSYTKSKFEEPPVKPWSLHDLVKKQDDPYAPPLLFTPYQPPPMPAMTPSLQYSHHGPSPVSDLATKPKSWSEYQQSMQQQTSRRESASPSRTVHAPRGFLF